MPTHYRNPGTHMDPRLVSNVKAEPLPRKIIERFRDALKYEGDSFDWWQEQ